MGSVLQHKFQLTEHADHRQQKPVRAFFLVHFQGEPLLLPGRQRLRAVRIPAQERFNILVVC